MICSIRDTAAGLVQIRTESSSCISEVDFEHSLMEAVSMEDGTGKTTDTELSGKMTLSQVFEAASEKYQVPLNLLKAVAKQESDFNVYSVSYAGAQGLMQLMPSTARSLGVTDSFDVWQNVMGGAKYLSQKLAMYNGNVRLALAAYNAGSGNVSKYGGVPPFKETRDYIRKVLTYMEQDVEIPDKTVTISSSASVSKAVKRQAQANRMELVAKDGKSESLVHEFLSSEETSISETISEKLRLYLQEQNRTSVSSIMEKLLETEALKKDEKKEWGAV